MKKYLILFVIALLSLQADFAYAQGIINTVVSLTGIVTDEVTRKPISVEMVIMDSRNNRINKVKSNSSDGYYYITGLKPDQKYKLIISGTNYFKEEVNIYVPKTDRFVEISKDILIKPLVENIRIPLLVPPFEVNQTKVRYGADIFLDEIKNSLKMNQTVKIEIQCYPDADKGAAENLKFTEARAKSLKEYFVKNGIKEDRVSIKANDSLDERNPPPSGKASKGKRYIGFTYLVIKSF